MKRRLGAALALATAAALAITGCGSSDDSSDGSITLKFVGADYGTGPADTTQKYWQKIADEFHTRNPSITVEVTTINWTDYDTKVKTQLQNKDYPDILQGVFYPQYATNGLVAPLGDVLSNPAAGTAVFKEAFSVDGVQYAAPFVTSARAMFYNKKAFAEAGIDKPPATWAELENAARALKAKGYIGYALPLGPEEAQAESTLWMLGNGGGWQSDGKYTIDSRQNVETFTFLKNLVAAGLTQPNPATYDRTANAAADFAAGKVGMEFNGPFLTATIASAGKLSATDYATAPVPGRTGPVQQTLGVADAIQAFKTRDAARAAAIKQFLDFALTDERQLAFARQYALLPGTQSALDSLKSDPVLGTFASLLPQTVQFPSDEKWTATVLPAVKKNIGLAVTGDPARVLGDLQAKATAGR
ncbi:carbohydrate ABC transporter substrate-binding protein, CUT1 family [Micromonospora citrea]|uniref:Carbohydrate ABC transporter substrate-binding protein, CUT1 family n=1 Tax=Micromonospora citrea TaxID=47855 RepID=A0A1C6VXP3_9ACTN|nr:extracellular solute-binding protein [Micromonospora citrea]SCL71095.1 carbohydrate ABC transporter substrate-binding protein, CUT1 family [Micromonospora citrea]